MDTALGHQLLKWFWRWSKCWVLPCWYVRFRYLVVSGLTSLLGSSRSQTPQLTTDLAGLLNQTASQLNGLGILGSGASLSSPGVIGSSGTGGTSIVGAGASLGAVGAVGGAASGAGAATGTPGVLPPPVGEFRSSLVLLTLCWSYNTAS